MDGVKSAEADHETGEARVTMAKGVTFDEEGARSALDKDMYTLTECDKYSPPTN